MTDSIRLQGIRVWGKHGIAIKERDLTQPFDVELVMHVDLAKSCLSDDLNDTIDYRLLHQKIEEIIQNHSYNLIERLAHEILNTIFVDKRILEGEISVSKPGKLNGTTPSIILRRTNSNQ